MLHIRPSQTDNKMWIEQKAQQKTHMHGTAYTQLMQMHIVRAIFMVCIIILFGFIAIKK